MEKFSDPSKKNVLYGSKRFYGDGLTDWRILYLLLLSSFCPRNERGGEEVEEDEGRAGFAGGGGGEKGKTACGGDAAGQSN